MHVEKRSSVKPHLASGSLWSLWNSWHNCCGREWKPRGKKTRHVLKNVNLSFPFYSLYHSHLSQECLLQENVSCVCSAYSISHGTLREDGPAPVKEGLSIEWGTSFHFLPVQSLWIKPCRNVKELQRAEEPHSSGPFSSGGPPRSGLVSEVLGFQLHTAPRTG